MNTITILAKASGRRGLEVVDKWSYNRTLSASAVRIPLGTHKYEGTIMGLLMFIRYIPIMHVVLPAMPL